MTLFTLSSEKQSQGYEYKYQLCVWIATIHSCIIDYGK